MDTKQRRADFYYCEKIIKRHSKSFYYAFSKLPTEKANAVYAIYAFCRTADDCVDGNQSPMEKRQALKQLKKELDLFEDYAELDKPLWRALRHVFNKYDMDIKPFYDQLIGQSMDVDFNIPKTMQELESYSYYVAGSVGLMLLPVIASKSSADLHSPATDLGIAMQITNILRDIGEDFHEKNRIYLPKDELSHFQYTQNDLHKGVINVNFINLWEKMAMRAESLYSNFLFNISHFDADSRLPVYLSAQVYRGILDAVRKNEYQCLSKRNFVSKDKMAELKLLSAAALDLQKGSVLNGEK